MSSFAATPGFSSPSAVTFALKPFIYPNKQSLNQVGSVVDIIILILTIFGACFILGGLALREFRTGTATVRQRLLAFLVLGDLLMGCIGVISPMYYLITNEGLPPGACDFTAFTLLATFWTQYINAVILCVSTYIILLHPLSKWTLLLQQHYIWLLPITWILAFTASGVAWRVTGFTFNGGFCYLSSSKGPKYWGDIFSLVPRAIVFIIVVSLYGHLFAFLRRPDRIGGGLGGFGGSSSDGRGGTTGGLTPDGRMVDEIRSGGLFLPTQSIPHSRRQSDNPIQTQPLNDAQPSSSAADPHLAGISSARRRSSTTPSKQNAWYKTSRLGRKIGHERDHPSSNAALDQYSPDQSNNRRFRLKSAASVQEGGEEGGGLAAKASSSRDERPPWESLELNVSDLNIPMENEENGGGERSRSASGQTRSEAILLQNRSTQSPTAPSAPLLNRLEPHPSPLRSFSASIRSSPHTTFSSLNPPPLSPALTDNPSSILLPKPSISTIDTHLGPSPLSSPSCEKHNPLSSPQPLLFQPPLELSSHTLAYIPGLDHRSLTPPHPRSSSPSAVSAKHSFSSSSSTPGTPKTLASPPLLPADTSAEPEREHIMSLAQILDAEQPSTGQAVSAGGGHLSQESMASYMNRKASLLMILFPIAYVALFSLSLARLITDFFVKDPIAWLSAVSRWLIFSQGIVDAILYGVVELKIKRQVRRKASRGHFDQQEWSATSQHAGGRGSGSRSGNGSRTGS